jgi:hypothetical protein
MDTPTLQALTTVAGATIVVAAVMQVLLGVLKLAPDTQDRFGPVLAILVGIVVVEAAVATVVTGAGKADYFQGLITGLFAGLAAIGVHSVVTHTVIGDQQT